MSTSKKLELLGCSRQHTWQDIEDLQQVWATILPDWSVLDRIDDLLSRYSLSLSFWDAAIIVLCLEAGVDRLYSEDFDACPQINGLEVVNPFAGMP